MLETGITPDFVTVDGGEGGTGAAPTELTNSVGTPLRDALIFVNGALIGIGLRDKVRVIASAKIFSAFHLLRVVALGADTANSARGMMLSLGCVQSRSCNTDNCPTGIATQNPSRNKALVVEDKSRRVANYHHETIKNLVELLAVCGLKNLEELEPSHINQRVKGTVIKNYAELYPRITNGCLLSQANVPDSWQTDWEMARAGPLVAGWLRFPETLFTLMWCHLLGRQSEARGLVPGRGINPSLGPPLATSCCKGSWNKTPCSELARARLRLRFDCAIEQVAGAAPRTVQQSIPVTFCATIWHEPERVTVLLPGPYASGMTHPSLHGRTRGVSWK